MQDPSRIHFVLRTHNQVFFCLFVSAPNKPLGCSPARIVEFRGGWSWHHADNKTVIHAGSPRFTVYNECVCKCVYVCAHAYLYEWVGACVYMCAYMCVCLCVCMHACICASVRVDVCMCTLMRICVLCVRVCVCVCVC